MRRTQRQPPPADFYDPEQAVLERKRRKREAPRVMTVAPPADGRYLDVEKVGDGATHVVRLRYSRDVFKGMVKLSNEMLARKRQEKVDAATKLQSAERQRQERVTYARKRAALAKLQMFLKRRMAWWQYAAAMALQAAMRRKAARDLYTKQREAAARLQSHARRLNAQSDVRRVRAQRHGAAVCVQGRARGMNVRRDLRRQHEFARSIQAPARRRGVQAQMRRERLQAT